MYQVRVVQGSPALYNAMIYGQKHPGAMNFLESQVERFEQMSSTLTQAGKTFFGNVRAAVDSVVSSDVMRAARAAMRSVDGVFQRDIIQPLYDVGTIQQAPPIMQRYIMACPEVREMYHAQRCDGYSESYVDHFPNDIGKDHYDYRRVMTGWVEAHEDGWKATVYLDELDEGDQELAIDQKSDIQATWAAVRALMRPGWEDPTNKLCGKL